MKKIIVLILLIALKVAASPRFTLPLTVSWQSINDTQGNFIYDFPENYEYHK